MGRLVSCYICKDKIDIKESKSHLDNGQKKSKYFCSNEHLQVHIDNLHEKELLRLDTDKFNKVDLYVAIEILQYELGQITPPSLKKRIQKLHKHYSYEVIKMCFELLKPELSSIINKKEFADESHMVNYIMVVVENNINDAYRVWKRRTQIAKKQESHSIDIDLMEEMTVEPSVKKKEVSNGIMDFLEEDDY